MLENYNNLNKEFLFKFMPFNLFALQTLVNNTLYFSKPSLLNDPLDCKFEIQLDNFEYFSKKTIKDIESKRPYWNQELIYLSKYCLLSNDHDLQKEFLIKFFKYDTNENYGICSFSQTLNENLLWSHYAEGAKGICIVFNKKELINSINKSLIGSYYELHHDFVRYDGVKKLHLKILKYKGLNYTQKHFYSKTKIWKYEKEYRLVLIKKYRSFYNFDYPYDFCHIVQFSKESIHSLILGENMELQNKIIIDNIFKNSSQNMPLLQHSF